MQQKQRTLHRITRIIVVLAALLVFSGWMLNTPPGLFGKADAIGYAVCHRISERSFHVGELQLPLCARCTGMFYGAVLCLIYQIIVGKKSSKAPPWQVIVPLALMVAAWIVDGSNSYLYLIKSSYPGILENIPNLYFPNNSLRVLTGTGMGIALAAALYPAFNQTVWIQPQEHPALNGLKSFIVLVILSLGIDALVLTESPIALYPIALISTLGIVVLLTMVYSIVWIVLMGQENSFTRIRQLWLPLVAGLTIAMIQITVIDLIRFWFTGTWGAFPL
jgi:uncharacterized membrane protein